MVDHCPTCGNPLHPEFVVTGKIKRRIIEYVQKHPGCTRDMIVNYAYLEDPNGGPLQAGASVSAMMAQINKKLSTHNLKLGRHQGTQGYSLLKIKEEQ